jgi:hypothetical protein
MVRLPSVAMVKIAGPARRYFPPAHRPLFGIARVFGVLGFPN